MVKKDFDQKNMEVVLVLVDMGGGGSSSSSLPDLHLSSTPAH